MVLSVFSVFPSLGINAEDDPWKLGKVRRDANYELVQNIKVSDGIYEVHLYPISIRFIGVADPNKETFELVGYISLDGVKYPIDTVDANIFKDTNIKSFSVRNSESDIFRAVDGILYSYTMTDENGRIGTGDEYTYYQDTLVCYPPARDDETYILPLTVKDINENAFSFIKDKLTVKVAAEHSCFLPTNEGDLAEYKFLFESEPITQPDGSVIIPKKTEIVGTVYEHNDNLEFVSFIMYPTANGDDLSASDFSYKIFAHGTARITGYEGTETELEIPSEIDGYSIVELDYRAFSGCENLTSVTLPESITFIDMYAFAGCTNLTSVNIPESVISIERAIFLNCKSLTEFTVPDTLSTIGYSMFSGCSNLTSVTIPEGVTSIERSAFYDCTSLTSITLPRSLKEIGDGAFGKYMVEILAPGTPFGVEVFEKTVEGFTIYGYAGTVAETYAIRNNLNFVALPEELVYGDVDIDGKISDITDIILLGKHVSGKVFLHENSQNYKNANCYLKGENGNALNIDDLKTLIDKLIGVDITLPVQ